MTRLFSFLAATVISAAPALAQVVSYEGNTFPEDEGWEHNEQVLQADRSIEDGWLVQVAEVVDPGPPEDPEIDSYNRSIAEFALADTFFVEWRVESDGPSEAIQATAPVALAAGGQSGVLYHFTIADDQVRFIQDVGLPIVFTNIEPVMPHTYRLEVYGADQYAWYIDGELGDAAGRLPEGPYPTSDSKITFRCKAGGMPTTTCWWDYIRFGVIPLDGSGDFNSDAAINEDDLYFFQECLETEAGNWVGCAWADFDFDSDVDCGDWDLFQLAWTDAGDPPDMPQCGGGNKECPGELSGDSAIDSVDLAILLGSWGPNAGHPADLNGDEVVNATDLAQLLGVWGPCP